MPPQTLQTKIPRYRRSKFEIESKGETNKSLNIKQNLSRRLKFEAPEDMNDKEVAHISQILRTSSKIAERFIFSLTENSGTNDQMFLHYSQEIKKMQGLKVFDFSAAEYLEITNLALKNMVIGFKSLKSLQSLKIHFVECIDIDNKGVEYVAKALKKLISLQTLDLGFEHGGEVEDGGMRILWENIKYLRNLQTLNVNLSYGGGLIKWNKIGDPAQELQRLKSLKNFKLNCALMPHLGLAGITKISKMVEAIEGLETIYLNLSECNLEKNGTKVLMKGFEGKENLKRIELNLGKNPVTDKGLIRIGESLQGLGMVEKIKIDLRDCGGITEKGIRLLKENLKCIASLKKLEILWKDSDESGESGESDESNESDGSNGSDESDGSDGSSECYEYKRPDY